ncbi:VOC family protein [Paenibacillus pasadenensis]|uniref:VOC family protein n=1 Tax=Paenibacillus pasadenensis TaxID=217090 RepID=UPI0020411EC8|nr:VOC family protein [Paenibacillus pasadenensis]MCM3748065.1 VOC family protein [Paenibacillus pasadenensis]
MEKQHVSIDPGVNIGKVRLKVKDLDRSIAYYKDVLGFSVLERSGSAAALGAPGQKTLVELEERPDAAKVNRRSAAGLYHFALLVPDRLSLGLVLRNMAEAGIEIGQGDHGVSEALYITDPDGNGIEIYRDRPRSEWKYDQNGYVLMGSDPVDVRGILDLAEGKEWKGLPAGTTIGHIHFHVSDLDASYRFYCGLMGFDMTADTWKLMGALFISAGGYHHHIGLNIWAGQGARHPKENSVGLRYVTIVFPNEAAREASAGRLRDGGVDIRQAEEGQLEVTDPSGNTLRLVIQ